jgi:branched-chain amino acid aminotransferase
MTALGERQVWFNGQLVPESQARVSIYDSALMFGDVVFEMTRSFNKQQFRLREHLVRLHDSMRMVHLDCGLTMDAMEAAVNEVIAANDPLFTADDEHRVMIDVTRGLLGIYASNVDIPSGPNVIIADFPLRWTVAGMGVLFDTGINAVVPSQRAIPAHLLDPKIKSRSRLHYLMANIQVSAIPGANNWALLLDPDGFVAEGTGDNFFIVKNGQLITPEGRNILRGISRGYVMELARDLGIPVVETNIDVYDVVTADEAFMSGTPFCLLPVTSIDGSQIGAGRPGEITRSILDCWGRNVDVDIAEQIRRWDAARVEAQSTAATPYQFRR